MLCGGAKNIQKNETYKWAQSNEVYIVPALWCDNSILDLSTICIYLRLIDLCFRFGICIIISFVCCTI